MLCKKALHLLLVCACLCLCLAFSAPARAQGGDAYALIDEVNALRASEGLAAYSVDAGLMSGAQAHADYMASLGTWTHERADGSNASSLGIAENVAMGMQLSPNYAVYVLWTDSLHWPTMVGHSAGSVGAGVASDGSNIYYVLNVLPAGQAIQARVADPAAAEQNVQAAALLQQATPEPVFLGILTSTPNPDGSIIHVVQSGESLWGIADAYGMSMSEIMVNSGNSPAAEQVFIGDRLVIRRAFTPTPTDNSTPTPTPITPQPTVFRPTRTPVPTATPMPTPTPTLPPPPLHVAFRSSQQVGLTMAGISAAGLILVLYFLFIRKPKE